MKSCSIRGLGYALAERRATNEGLSTFVDTNDEWISSKTGIHARCTSEEKNTSDLGTHVAHVVINKSGIDPKGIDLITTATFASNQTIPFTACLIQEKPGLNNQHIMVSDLNAACNGSLYVLQGAHVMLTAGQVMCVLIIGVEVIPKQLDWDGHSICIIFVDGTGAATAKQGGTNKRMLHFAGSTEDAAGAIHNDAPEPRSLSSEQPYQSSVIYIEGNATFRFVMRAMQEVTEDVLKQAGERIEDIDWIVPHQASVRTINNAYERVHIDKEHVYINIEGYGNTSAANTPLALGEMSEKGLLQPGMKIVLSGFDAGLT